MATRVSVEKYMHVMRMPVYELTLGRLRDNPSAHTYVGLPCTTPSIAVDMFYTTKHCRYMIHEIGWENCRDPFHGEVMFKRYFWIGNMKGQRNGWSYDEHIYGRLVEVIAPGEKGWEVA